MPKVMQLNSDKTPASYSVNDMRDHGAGLVEDQVANHADILALIKGKQLSIDEVKLPISHKIMKESVISKSAIIAALAYSNKTSPLTPDSLGNQLKIQARTIDKDLRDIFSLMLVIGPRTSIMKTSEFIKILISAHNRDSNFEQKYKSKYDNLVKMSEDNLARAISILKELEGSEGDNLDISDKKSAIERYDILRLLLKGQGVGEINFDMLDVYDKSDQLIANYEQFLNDSDDKNIDEKDLFPSSLGEIDTSSNRFGTISADSKISVGNFSQVYVEYNNIKVPYHDYVEDHDITPQNEIFIETVAEIAKSVLCKYKYDDIISISVPPNNSVDATIQQTYNSIQELCGKLTDPSIYKDPNYRHILKTYFHFPDDFINNPNMAALKNKKIMFQVHTGAAHFITYVLKYDKDKWNVMYNDSIQVVENYDPSKDIGLAKIMPLLANISQVKSFDFTSEIKQQLQYNSVDCGFWAVRNGILFANENDITKKHGDLLDPNNENIRSRVLENVEPFSITGKYDNNKTYSHAKSTTIPSENIRSTSSTNTSIFGQLQNGFNYIYNSIIKQSNDVPESIGSEIEEQKLLQDQFYIYQGVFDSLSKEEQNEILANDDKNEDKMEENLNKKANEVFDKKLASIKTNIKNKKFDDAISEKESCRGIFIDIPKKLDENNEPVPNDWDKALHNILYLDAILEVAELEIPDESIYKEIIKTHKLEKCISLIKELKNEDINADNIIKLEIGPQIFDDIRIIGQINKIEKLIEASINTPLLISDCYYDLLKIFSKDTTQQEIFKDCFSAKLSNKNFTNLSEILKSDIRDNKKIHIATYSDAENVSQVVFGIEDINKKADCLRDLMENEPSRDNTIQFIIEELQTQNNFEYIKLLTEIMHSNGLVITAVPQRITNIKDNTDYNELRICQEILQITDCKGKYIKQLCDQNINRDSLDLSDRALGSMSLPITSDTPKSKESTKESTYDIFKLMPSISSIIGLKKKITVVPGDDSSVNEDYAAVDYRTSSKDTHSDTNARSYSDQRSLIQRISSALFKGDKKISPEISHSSDTNNNYLSTQDHRRIDIVGDGKSSSSSTQDHSNAHIAGGGKSSSLSSKGGGQSAHFFQTRHNIDDRDSTLYEDSSAPGIVNNKNILTRKSLSNDMTADLNAGAIKKIFEATKSRGLDKQFRSGISVIDSEEANWPSIIARDISIQLQHDDKRRTALAILFAENFLVNGRKPTPCETTSKSEGIAQFRAAVNASTIDEEIKPYFISEAKKILQQYSDRDTTSNEIPLTMRGGHRLFSRSQSDNSFDQYIPLTMEIGGSYDDEILHDYNHNSHSFFPPPNIRSTFLTAIRNAPSEDLYNSRKEALNKLLNCAEETVNSKDDDETYATRFENKNDNKISYKEVADNQEQQQHDIDFMAAKLATNIQLEPVVIYGGTYEQQTMAIKSALSHGFTAITIYPPSNGEPTEEYNSLVDIAETITSHYVNHAQCLDNITNDPKAILKEDLFRVLDENQQQIFNQIIISNEDVTANLASKR